MALSEFEVINRYFARASLRRRDVLLGIGDDAAITRVPPGFDLAVSTDTLVAGVHFHEDMPPADIGCRAVAVNLSDMAAMGAEPAWMTLALTLPAAEESWLERFAAGLFAAAQAHGVQLIGGDTTRGPLTITVTLHGLLPGGRALRRSGARPGDRIYVSGSVGDARLALDYVTSGRAFPPEHRSHLHERFYRPQARVALGRRLLDIAGGAIDVSDGLAADLGHILDASGVGATVELACLPLSPAVRALLDREQAWCYALGGGDDYELCFTVPEARVGGLEAMASAIDCALTRIGRIEPAAGLRLLRADGTAFAPHGSGYRHF